MNNKNTFKRICTAAVAVSLLIGAAPQALANDEYTPVTALYAASPAMNRNLTDGANSNLSRMGDGKFHPGETVVFASGAGDALGSDYYIDIITKNPVDMDYIMFMTHAGTRGDQNLTRIGIDYLDPDSGEWIRYYNDYDISAFDDGEAHLDWTGDYGMIKNVEVDFGKAVSVVRVTILGANRTWGNFRIDEMSVFGTEQSGTSGNNLLNNAVRVIDNNASGTNVYGLYDGVYKDSAFVTSKYLSEGTTDSTLPEPYELEFDFGAETYKVRGLRLFTDLAAAQGITDAKFYYYANNEWVLAETINFERSSDDAKMYNAAADYVEFDEVKASRFKLSITGARHYWGDFRIDELELIGENADAYPEITRGIMELSESGDYNEYKTLLEEIDEVDDAELKEYYTGLLNSVVDEIKQNETRDAIYELFYRRLTLKGWLFREASDAIEVNIYGPNGEQYLQDSFNVSSDGTFEKEIDMSGVTSYGTYRVEYDGFTKEFVITRGDSDATIYSFRVDGVSGSISGNIITIKLPTGSILTGRVPVFSIPADAKAFSGNEELISGMSVMDLSRGTTIRVISADGTNSRTYSIDASVMNGEPKRKNMSSSSQSFFNGSINSGGFDDVDSSHYAYDYIEKLRARGVVVGDDNNRFNPNAAVTREEFVVMLVRAMGYELSESESVFVDAAEHWSEQYIMTAYEYGLVAGESNTVFGIGKNIKRCDIAVILDRLLVGYGETDSELFDDDALIADYARESIYKLKALGVLEGDRGLFRPNDTASRADTAIVICRALELLERSGQ